MKAISYEKQIGEHSRNVVQLWDAQGNLIAESEPQPLPEQEGGEKNE